MKSLKIALMVIAVSLLFASFMRAEEGKTEHIMVTTSDLKWTDAPSVASGAKMVIIEGVLKEAAPFTLRLKLPAGTKLPLHTHPAVERVTVISGTLYLGIGEKTEPKNAKGLGAGSVAIMPAGTKMFAFTKKETVIQLHGTGPWGIHYVNSEEAPKMK
ncbi:MAG: cupin domain-containing protein [Nitrospirae bacterium]|nr:cupin domain-containing protein [Nitrospirota bacterium]